MRKTATPNSIAITCLLAGIAALATSQVSRAEKIGKVSEPLVAGNEVSPAEQQSQTLVALDMGGFSCSGVLLNSEWVIAAAHCFQNPDVKASEVDCHSQVVHQAEEEDGEGALHPPEGPRHLARRHAV